MLKMSNPSLIRRLAGTTCIGVLALGAGYAAWAAAPTAVPVITAPFEFLSDVIADEAPAPQPIILTEADAFLGTEPAAPTVEDQPPAAPGPASQPPSGLRTFAAMFDGDAPIMLEGRIVSVDYSGPYAVAYVQGSSVSGVGSRTFMPDGTAVTTTGGPATANNQLWRVEVAQSQFVSPENRASVRIGDEVRVRGYNAKDTSCQPTCYMNARDMSYRDGTRTFTPLRNPNSIDSVNCADLRPEATPFTRERCAEFMAQLRGSFAPAAAALDGVPPPVITRSPISNSVRREGD